MSSGEYGLSLFFIFYVFVSFSFHTKIEIGYTGTVTSLKIEILWYHRTNVATHMKTECRANSQSKSETKVGGEMRRGGKKFAANCFSMPAVVLHMS